MAAKRGDRVAPPGKPGGWEELCRNARSNTWEAWIILTERPTAPENPARQHPLCSSLSERQLNGRTLEQ